MTDTRERARELLESVVQELLAKLEEIDGNKPGAFTLRSSGIVGSRFQQKRDAILEAIASLATVSPLPVQSEPEEAECPICASRSTSGKDPALNFCDKHYRQYLATFQIAPRDLAAYRADRIAALSAQPKKGLKIVPADPVVFEDDAGER